MKIKRAEQTPTSRPPEPSATPDDTLHTEELYVVWMINRGLAMTTVPYDQTATRVADEPEDPYDDRLERYRDAVADVLQAADHAGLDAEELCVGALTQQRAIKAQGREAALHRSDPVQAGPTPSSDEGPRTEASEED